MAARVLRSLGAAAPPRLRPALRGLTTSTNRSREDSWLKSLFVRKVDPRKDAHSNLLAKKETSSLYKIQFHNVKPECLEAYNKICQEVLPKIHEEKHYPCTLVGTWNTWYGEQDQAVHLWRYEGGYPALNEVMNKLRENKEFVAFRKERGNMLLSRKNQLLLEFSFWNEPVPRPGPNIYELRSYQLRPGTMIEWGNYWARAIRFRQDNEEAVGGFFSQIGQLYMVHHLWGKNLFLLSRPRFTGLYGKGTFPYEGIHVIYPWDILKGNLHCPFSYSQPTCNKWSQKELRNQEDSEIPS